MRPSSNPTMHSASLLLFVISALLVTVFSTSTERPNPKPGSPSLLLLTIQNSKRAASSSGRPKPVVQVEETPPKPLAQVMLRNVTADALKPPLGAAQVAPPPKKLVDVDVCRGYYDVMGQYDLTFNCSKDNFIYCCGTCHYRFCCQHRSNRLDQNSCNNYNSPVWAKTSPPVTIPLDLRSDPDFDPLRQQTNNTVYVIGGVISFTVAVAVGIKVAFHKASRRPRHRDIHVPRSLVDILRHQSSPVQQGERNNSVALGSGTNEGTLGRPSKNLYTPVSQSKDNRIGNLHHNFIHHSGSSPKHTATIERAPRMNNAQLASSGTLLSSKHNNTYARHPSFHHSLHNLAQLPPSYEAAMKPEINRYSSLKRLEKDLDDYSGYYTSKRRPNNAPPSFHSSQHHLPWGGDYTLGARGTLPLHASRPRIHPQSASPVTPNPYPLQPPKSQYNSNFDTLSKPPRRVMSQEQLLTVGDGNTLSKLSKNQQHQYYKAIASAAKSSNTQTPKKSQERLLMSPDRLGEDVGGGVGVGDFGGMTPTLPRFTQQQKAQSQQNVCATPSLNRHHMIKMNSHPTSGREQERNVAVPSHGPGAVGRPEVPGGGTGTIGHTARRMAFATKRQNTIEQLHFIPGGGGGGGPPAAAAGTGAGAGGNQGLRTGSKNEVTV
ncbi:protein shisa-7 isoform X1 [Paramormyrops kingsleyae]|uniref:protein shisa-7 isoform X1 n=1 Tax=Paramormyrops kingsleyae TaxID=1676925 RepID=UPI000CD6704C|nr:protein shisa-7-like isoform X1 [Paramormyrops kingsleyae]